jgi:hypothetical protein
MKSKYFSSPWNLERFWDQNAIKRQDTGENAERLQLRQGDEVRHLWPEESESQKKKLFWICWAKKE